MDLWAAIPFRGFACGKSRLSAALDERQRVALNRRLFARAVDCAVESLGARCVMVISPDEAVIADAARQGLAALVEPQGAGLNGALGFARTMAAERGAQALLSLSADLPLLEAADLDAARDAWEGDGTILLAADEAGTGTNALIVPVTAPFAYAMGQGSAALHRAAARQAGISLHEIRRPGLAFDLDLPEDLARWRALTEVAA
jgi:2-phospho-L-lactate guanylyltransferase